MVLISLRDTNTTCLQLYAAEAGPNLRSAVLVANRPEDEVHSLSRLDVVGTFAFRLLQAFDSTPRLAEMCWVQECLGSTLTT